MALNTMPKNEPIAVTAKRCATIVAAVVGLAAWSALQRSDAQATPPAPAPTPARAAESAPASAPPTSAAPSATAASTAASANVRIELTTTPPLHASVSWGNTRLGRITPQEPLVIERPRDSGPLDVIVRAVGFLPVHTRAHTFADNKLQVKMTRPDQKSSLLGYRAPIDAGTPMPEEDAVSPALPDAPEWDMTKPLPAEPAPPATGP